MTEVGRRNFALILVAALLIATFALYHSTFTSMASVWFGSTSFLHGILILPMSAYLIWRMRDRWMNLPARPAYIGIVLLAVAVLAWALAGLVSVQLVSQLAFIAMLTTVIWSVLGTQTVRVVHFPLLYAFFAVPFGEFLVPVLMDWTAYFAVQALQLTGVPVLREGLYFALPSGDFEVIEACSGIRFLLVTVVLGLYFAHETYRSLQKRLIFVVLAALAIVVANGIRAYTLVLITHFTDMKYGTGQGHIYMGWVIFLVVITLLFWFGRRFEDPEVDARPVEAAAITRPAAPGGRRIEIVMVSAVVLAMLVAGPVLLEAGRERLSGSLAQPMVPKATAAGTNPQVASFGYRPAFPGARDVLAARYLEKGQPVELHIVFYSERQQGNELVGWNGKLFDPEKWRRLQRGTNEVSAPNTAGKISVQTMLVTDNRQLLQLWYWYDIGGVLVSRPMEAKLRQAWNAVSGRRRGDALVVIATPVSATESDDNARLEQFLRDNLDRVRACLRPDTAEDTFCTAPPALDGKAGE